MSNPYVKLVVGLKEAILKRGLDPEHILVRVSQGTDLLRVLTFGTSRAARSSKLWDKWDTEAPPLCPWVPILHEDVLIASRFADIERDAPVERGTLKHKMSIYDQPFFTVYREDCFKEMLCESSPEDPQNHGRHFLFTVANKRSALLGVLPILAAPGGYVLGIWVAAG